MKRTTAIVWGVISLGVIYVLLVPGSSSNWKRRNESAVEQKKVIYRHDNASAAVTIANNESSVRGRLEEAWWIDYTMSEAIDFKDAAKKRWSMSHCSLQPLDESDCVPADFHQPKEMVVIFQYGKCGSSAMRAHMTNHLQPKGTRVVHAHGLGIDVKTEIQQRMKRNENVWIVTMVRNRFLRDLSSLFENRVYYGVTAKLSMRQIIAKNRQVWYSAKPRISQHWFSDIFRNQTGVDLVQHASEFDFSRRSLLVASSQYRILLLRYEDIADWGRVLPHYFPNLPPNVFPPANQKTNDWLGTAYKKVSAIHPYKSAEIAATMAGDTALFYRPCERQAMARAAAEPLPAGLVL